MIRLLTFLRAVALTVTLAAAAAGFAWAVVHELRLDEEFAQAQQSPPR